MERQFNRLMDEYRDRAGKETNASIETDTWNKAADMLEEVLRDTGTLEGLLDCGCMWNCESPHAC